MKNKFLASAFVAASMVSFSAQAADNYYVGLGASASAIDDIEAVPGTKLQYKTGYGVGGVVGKHFGENLRADLGIDYRHHNLESVKIGGTTFGATGKASSRAFMANLYYDINNDSTISPYVGAGVGYGQLLDNSNNVWDGFAYQAMTGLNYKMMDNIVGYVGYKFFSIVNPKFKSNEVNYDSHNIEVGFRYEFGGPDYSQYSAMPNNYAYNSSEGQIPNTQSQQVVSMRPVYQGK